MSMPASPAHDTPQQFQSRVATWVQSCFGEAVTYDIQERGDRLLEEVLELLQSKGYDPARVAALTRYVFTRPVGQPNQELGGVMVTLAAYAHAAGLDMVEAGAEELKRIEQPAVVEKCRIKQASKASINTPLPGNPHGPDGTGQPHRDDLVVDDFAGEMKFKLAKGREKGRGGWDEPGLNQLLSDQLREHVDKGDPRDVANFACFIWARGESIAPASGEMFAPGTALRPMGWKFNRVGDEAFVAGPNGGGWFKSAGTLWQRTLFDLVSALATGQRPSVDAAFEPITSGKLEWHVLHCPGWPAGIDFPTREQALDHIVASGDDKTRLASWWHQANRIDYTPEQLAEMLAERARQSGVAS